MRKTWKKSKSDAIILNTEARMIFCLFSTMINQSSSCKRTLKMCNFFDYIKALHAPLLSPFNRGSILFNSERHITAIPKKQIALTEKNGQYKSIILTQTKICLLPKALQEADQQRRNALKDVLRCFFNIQYQKMNQQCKREKMHKFL